MLASPTGTAASAGNGVSSHRPALRVLCAVWALAACVTGCDRDGADLGTTAKVERGRLEHIVVATGTIEPEREVDVRPRISGIVEKIHVKEGDTVVARQPLLEIERELLEVKADEARAALRGARVDLGLASTELERAKKLRLRGAETASRLDEAQARRDAASAMVTKLRAALESLEVQLRYATVTASIDGKVLDIHVEEGSAVSAVTAPTGGSQLLTLAAAESLHLAGLVDENEISRIRVDQEARIRTEAYGDEIFPGRVRDIAPIGERRQNVTYFEVEIAVLGEGASKLKPRMSGDAEIIADVIEDALLVPETALVYEGEDIFVERVTSRDPPRLERRKVRLGSVNGSRVHVLEGVDAGDEVKLH
jgi:HlyD family secretion protein